MNGREKKCVFTIHSVVKNEDLIAVSSNNVRRWWGTEEAEEFRMMKSLLPLLPWQQWEIYTVVRLLKTTVTLWGVTLSRLLTDSVKWPTHGKTSAAAARRDNFTLAVTDYHLLYNNVHSYVTFLLDISFLP